METNLQIVYSRRIMLELVRRGFIPVRSLTNPEFDDYLSWLFEDTEEFRKVFNEIVASSKASKSSKEEKEDGNI